MQTHRLGVLRQYTAAISAAISMFIVGNWISWASPAVKYIIGKETKLNMSPEEVSWAVALLDFGNVLSPIPSSFVSNWLGRKKTIIGLSFGFLLTWLLVIFGNNAYYLYVARILVGLCKGLTFVVVPIYLGEIAGTEVRGGVGTIFCSMMNYGMLFELSIGPFVSYDTLNMISSPFAVLFFLLFIRFPESPYFFLMKGRLDEAKKSLAWFRNLKEDSPVLEEELKKMSVDVEEDMKQEGGYKDLLRTSASRKAMLISMGFAMFQRLTGVNAIIAYSSITLPPSGAYFSPQVYMIFFGITTIIGQSICVTLIDIFGRKPLLMISSAGCGLSTGISALFYWLNVYYDLYYFFWVPYACIVLFGISFSIGLGTIPSIIVVELFSSDVRSYAAAIAAICYAFTSFLINKIYIVVQLTIGVHYMFLFFTVCSIISFIFTCTVFFETSGKTFSEIQSILKRENISDVKNTNV